MNSKQKRKLQHVARKLGVNLPNAEPVPKHKTESPPLEQYHFLAGIRLVWTIVVGFATIVTIAVGVLAFRADVSVEPYASQDERTPFAELFYVQNTSLLSIHDVDPGCSVLNVMTQSEFGASGFTLRDPSEHRTEVDSQDRTTVTCRLMNTVEPYKSLKIGIRVPFRPSFWPFTKCKIVKFDGLSTNAGKYVWTYQGASRCDQLSK